MATSAKQVQRMVEPGERGVPEPGNGGVDRGLQLGEGGAGRALVVFVVGAAREEVGAVAVGRLAWSGAKGVRPEVSSGKRNGGGASRPGQAVWPVR